MPGLCEPAVSILVTQVWSLSMLLLLLQQFLFSHMGSFPICYRIESHGVTKIHSPEPNEYSCFLEMLFSSAFFVCYSSSTCISLTVRPRNPKARHGKCHQLESKVHEKVSKEAAPSYLFIYLLSEERKEEEKTDITSLFSMLVQIQKQKLIKMLFKAFPSLVSSTCCCKPL